MMQLDAWFSMVVFTLATVAFYVMGAGVLNGKFAAGGPVQLLGRTFGNRGRRDHHRRRRRLADRRARDMDSIRRHRE